MIRPAIVWALDEPARHTVDDWYDRLNQEQQKFIRTALGWEDVRDHIRDFNLVETAEDFLKIGVGEEGAGTHVVLVLVAYGMGAEAFTGWSEIHSRIRNLAKEVVQVEKHHVLLANHEQHKLQDRSINTGDLVETPWLISSRNSRRQTLGNKEQFRLFQRLLRVLTHADRPLQSGTETPLGRFYEAPLAEGCVRLLGTPIVSLDEVVEQVAKDCAAATAFRIMHKNREVRSEELVGGNFVHSLVDRLGRCDIDGDLFVRQLFGKNGLAGVSTENLWARGKNGIKKLRKRLETAGKDYSPPPKIGRTRKRGGFWSWLMRLLGFQKEEPVSRADEHEFKALSKAVLREEMEPALDACDVLADMFEELEEWVYSNRLKEKVYLPPGRIEGWRKQFSGLLLEMMDNASRERFGDIRAQVVINRFEGMVGDDFDANLIHELVEGKWAETHEDSSKLRHIGSGKFYVYSGAAPSGQQVEAGPGVCGNSGPALDKNIFGQIGFWGNHRPDLLRASFPVSASDLRW